MRDRTQGPPGTGSTTADRVFTAVSPRVGELSSSPNPTLASTPVSVVGRLVGVCKGNLSWAFHLRVDPRNGTGGRRYNSYRFQDGSILTLVESPLPGPHELGSGPDTGYMLDSVEIMR